MPTGALRSPSARRLRPRLLRQALARPHRRGNQILERAAAAGIPVCVFDSAVNFADYVTFVATDNFAAGGQAAREIGRLLQGRGSVAMVMQKPGGAPTGLRERGFVETLEREFPAVRLVARQFGMGDRARSRAADANILTALAGLQAMFGSSEAATIGIIRAVERRDRAGQIKIVSSRRRP